MKTFNHNYAFYHFHLTQQLGVRYIQIIPFLPIEAVHFLKMYFYTLKQSLFTLSKMDRQLLRQKVCQRISVMKTNTLYVSEYWHFHSLFVLKTTKTPVFVFITEIL